MKIDNIIENAVKAVINEYTDSDFSGAELIRDVMANKPDNEAMEFITKYFPNAVKSMSTAQGNLKASDASPIKKRMGQYAPMFIHVQYNKFKDDANQIFAVHQRQYYNSNFKNNPGGEKFNPQVTKLAFMGGDDRKDNMGEILVVTDEYIKDLSKLRSQGKLDKTMSESVNESVNEEINTDIVNRNINLLDKAADMAIKNPKGNVVELAKIIKKYISGIRNSIKESKVNEAVKEVVLSNEILDFLEERGIVKGSDAQKVHKDLTAFLKEKLIKESTVNEYGPMRGSGNRNYSTNGLVDRIGDLDDLLMSDRKAEREWEEMSQNYLDGERGSEYWGDLGDQELQDAIDGAESLMKKYRIKESIKEGTMSDIHMLAQEASTIEEFIKEFMADYGDKFAGASKPKLDKWLADLYTDAKSMKESKLNENRGQDEATDLIAKLERTLYTKLSDLELDAFKKEMAQHFGSAMNESTTSSKTESITKRLKEDTEYQEFFKSTMHKFGVKSPKELKGKKKAEFFNYVDKNYKAKSE